jgi:hypothetical protein
MVLLPSLLFFLLLLLALYLLSRRPTWLVRARPP